MTLASRVVDLAAAIRDKFNAIAPRLIASGGNAGQVYAKSASSHGWVDDTATVTFVIDGGGATITSGTKGDIIIPFDGTILGWTLLGDQTGSAVVEISKASYTNWPTVSVITASAKPTLSNAQKATSSTLTGWTTAVSANDVFRIDISGVSSIQRVTLSLRVRKA